jgi:hypothetical protein
MTKEEKIARLKTFIGKTVNCDLIFNALCEASNWRYDTEESDIVLCFMRTWKNEGYIAKILLEEGISAPPDGETGEIAGFLIGTFDKEEYINIPDVSVDRAENDLLYYKQKYGDPNYALDLEEMELEAVPDAIFDTLYAEIFDTLSESVID